MAQKEPSGPLIAIIIIVIVLALGGAYYLVREINALRGMSQGLSTSVTPHANYR
ncbi:hypothetical protein KGO06_03065 [Patescibacteria group bacterium]|nr:hypothetical protein [Patescibacteria group bacterium]